MDFEWVVKHNQLIDPQNLIMYSQMNQLSHQINIGLNNIRIVHGL